MADHFAMHLVRRGIDHAQERFQPGHEDGDKNDYASTWPLALSVVVWAIMYLAINYTLGQLIPTLAMIESPARIAMIDSKPPPYADNDNPKAAPPSTAIDLDTDIEVTVIDPQPITRKIRTTIRHLHNIGGFFARWRGARLSILYHLLQSLATNFLGALLGACFNSTILGHAVAFVLVTLGLARLHMSWTFAMIAHPGGKSFLRRLPARKDCRVILLPTLVYAIAYQASGLLPAAVALMLGLGHANVTEEMESVDNCHALMFLGLKFLAVFLTYVTVSIAVLFPASVTLARIEATLLPETDETIVPFDKEAVLGDIDMSAKGAKRALFVQAWRSFDRPARLRLVKLYVKLVWVQLAVAALMTVAIFTAATFELSK